MESVKVDPQIGRVIDGRYRVIERLGEGGMAAVYLAEQIAIARPVAIKVLWPQFSRDPGALDRFRREARAISRLSHPNTVAIYDFGSTLDGSLFIAMEYVAGQDLATARGAGDIFGWRRVARIAVQIAASLADAHEHGVIHRDLKPENVMLTRRGSRYDLVKVLDFGIAKILREQDGGRLTGNMTLGTAEFVAPEVLTGGVATAETDVYSLGVLLFELLSGALPFAVNGVEAMLRAHVLDPPRALAEAHPGLDVPPAIASLIERMLAKKPADRPRGMHAIIDAFTAALEETGSGPSLAPQGTPTPAPELTASSPALRTLFERFDERAGLPGFAEHIAEINRLCSAPDASLEEVARAAGRDLGVTERLLRLVNSPFYRQFNAPVASLSRAVVLLGLEQVRRAALGLVYWQMVESAERDELVDATLGSVASGVVARELAGQVEVDADGAFTCALFRNFGRHLVLYCAPDLMADIRHRMATERCSEQAAVRAVFGAGFEDIGGLAAERLSFPGQVIESMRARQPTAPANSAPERLHALAALATDVVGAIVSAGNGGEERNAVVARLAVKHARALGLEPSALTAAVSVAAEELREQVSTLGPIAAGSRLMPALEDAARPAPVLTPDEHLSVGVSRLQAAVEAGGNLETVVRLALDVLHNGAQARRALVALRHFASGELTARVGVGPDIDTIIPRFRFSAEGATDLIRDAVTWRRDLVVEDSRLVWERLPAWYREHIHGASLGVYPIVVGSLAVGLIYVDDPRHRQLPPWLSPTRQARIKVTRDAVQRAFRRLGARPGGTNNGR